jgi:chain length determinant protein tyrosine kinase EpsG
VRSADAEGRLGGRFAGDDRRLPPTTLRLDESGSVVDRSIGDLIRETRKLTDEQIQQIAAYQREHGVRFGEAAVALKLATRDDVVWALSQQFHYPYALAQSVQNPELVVATNPFSDEAEVFRELRSQLLMGTLAPDEPRRALAIASPNPGDGKSFLAANLAIAFSQLNGRTLLVDADLRTPRQHQIFGIDEPSGGLSSVLSGRAGLNIVHQVPGLPSLFVLPSGPIPPNPLELIQRPAFNILLIELLNKFDQVIVDTPAASHGADVRVIASKCGATLVVGREGKSRLEDLERLTAALSKGSMRFAGIVLNRH